MQASALTQAGGFIFAGGMMVGLTELALWWIKQYWPFATLSDLVGTCTTCNDGLAAPLVAWLWSQPLWLLVSCSGLALMLLGLALRREA